MGTFEKFLDCCGDEKNYYGISVKKQFHAFKDKIDKCRENVKQFSESEYSLLSSQYNLIDEKIFFIRAYTGSFSSWLNGCLRNGYPSFRYGV